MNATVNTITELVKIFLNAVLTAKGQYIDIRFKSDVKTSAKHKDVNIVKIVNMKVRTGIDFGNLKEIKEEFEKGLRTDIKPLPYGEWEIFPFVIDYSEKNQKYLRLYPSKGKNHYATSTFFVNGIETPKMGILEYLTPSEQSKILGNREIPKCFNIKAQNLLSIG